MALANGVLGYRYTGARYIMPIRAEVEGLDKAVDKLKPLINIKQSLKPILHELAIDMATFATLRINKQQDPSGVAYRPLAQSTKDARARGRLLPGPKRGKKARHGKGQSPPYLALKWSGAMIRSIFARAVTMGVDFGTHVSYSIYHQYGTDTAPRRSFFPIDMYTKPEKNGPGGVFWNAFKQKCQGILK